MKYNKNLRKENNGKYKIQICYEICLKYVPVSHCHWSHTGLHPEMIYTSKKAILRITSCTQNFVEEVLRCVFLLLPLTQQAYSLITGKRPKGESIFLNHHSFFFFLFIIFFHYHFCPLYPSPTCSQHAVVHIHEFFFLFA